MIAQTRDSTTKKLITKLYISIDFLQQKLKEVKKFISDFEIILRETGDMSPEDRCELSRKFDILNNNIKELEWEQGE